MANGKLQPILGQADSTLVQAAYRAAMANVPKDLSPIYKEIGDDFADGMASLGEGFSGLIVGAGKLATKLVEENSEMRELKADAEYNNSGSSGGGGGSPFQFNISTQKKSNQKEYYNYIDSYGNSNAIRTGNFEEQLQFIKSEKKKVRKQFLGGKMTIKEARARQKQFNEMRDTSEESVKVFLTAKEEIDKVIGTGAFNQSPSNMMKAQFLRAIQANGESLENGTRAVMGFDGKGKMVFSYVDKEGNPMLDGNGKPITVAPGNARSLITEVDNGMRIKLNDIINKGKAHGKSGGEYDANYEGDVTQAVEVSIPTIVAWNDAKAFKYNGATQTLEETLYGYGENLTEENRLKALQGIPARIWASLGPEYDVSGPDGGEKDGKTTVDDFRNLDNYMKFVNAVLEPSDSNFSLQRSKNVLAGEIQKDNKKGHQIEKTKFDVNALLKDPSASTLEERRAAANISTFTQIVDNKSDQTRIDLNWDAGGNITKYIEVTNPVYKKGKLVTPGKIISHTAVKGGGTEPKEITLREAASHLSRGSGQSTEDIFGTNYGYMNQSFTFESTKSDEGFFNVAYGKTEEKGVASLEEKYKNVKGLTFKDAKMGSDRIKISYKKPGQGKTVVWSKKFDPWLEGDAKKKQDKDFAVWYAANVGN